MSLLLLFGSLAPITATGDNTEADDALVSAVAVAVSADASLSDTPDVIAGAFWSANFWGSSFWPAGFWAKRVDPLVSVLVAADLVAADTPDVFAGTFWGSTFWASGFWSPHFWALGDAPGSVLVAASGGATDASDTLDSAGTSAGASGVTANLLVTDDPDTIDSTVLVAYLPAPPSSGGIVSRGLASRPARRAIRPVPIVAEVALREDADRVTAQATVSIAALTHLAEVADTVHAQAGPGALGRLSGRESTDRVISTGHIDWSGRIRSEDAALAISPEDLLLAQWLMDEAA